MGMKTLVCVLACASACKSEKPAAQSGPGTSTAAPSAKKWFDAAAPVGVWIGIDERMSPTTMADRTTYLSTKMKLVTYVMWPDGHASEDLPWSGLADFDRDAWERDVGSNASLGGRPGTWAPDGDGWSVTYKGFTTPMKLAGDELRVGKARLKHASDVTGATLDGAYTWWSDAEDPLLAGPGCQQLVLFTSSGTFDNRGGFARTCPAGADDPGRPGTGTYEIRDYSLLLRYADGRTDKKLILARQNSDLHSDTANAVIMGQVWSRRTGAIANAAPAAAVVADTPSGDSTTFDGLAFATPPGTMERTKTSLSFRVQDGDEFCMTSVFTGLPSTGTPEKNFAADWRDIMLNGRTADETPTPQKAQAPSGLVFTVGGSMTTEASNSARVYRALLVFEVGNRRVSVMMTAPTESQLAGCKVEDFIRSVRGV